MQNAGLDTWTLFEEEYFSIQHPESWEVNTSGLMGTSFLLFSPVISAEDQFRENVNLLVQDLEGHNLDLDEYVEISEGQITTMITGGHIIDSKRVVTDTFEYHKVIYTGKQGIFNLKFEQYYWVISDKAYILTLTCEELNSKHIK